MARNLITDPADKTGFWSNPPGTQNSYNIRINDTVDLKVTDGDVVATNPWMSASIAVSVLSASSATATLATGSHLVLADATTAEMGLTLPSAATVIGREYTVKKIDESANAVLLSGASGDSIEGAAFQTIASQNGSVTVMSDGVGWHITRFFSGALLT